MATVDELAAQLETRPIVAVLPPGEAATALRVARVLLDAGCAALCVPWPQPGWRETLAALAALTADRALLGAAAVPGPTEAREAVLAGAQLVISTGLRPPMVPVCHGGGALCALGALTPTEALTATEAAADYVRIGPIDLVGGPAYLAALRAQLPWVRFVAAGNIGAEALLGYRTNGAALFELGPTLLPPPLLAPDRAPALTTHVATFLAAAAT